MFKKLKDKITKSFTDPIEEHPKETRKVKYLYFFLGLFSLIGIIWSANIFMALEIPTANDFVSKQYTLIKFEVTGNLKRTYYNIEVKEFCGKFTLGRAMLSDLHKKAFVDNVKVGEKFTCKIKNNDVEKMIDCDKIKLWEITTKTDTFLYLSDTIDSEKEEKSFFAPIIFLVSLSASLYFFYGFYIVKNYKRKRKK